MTLKNSAPEVIEIYFGEKQSQDALAEDSWNPAYFYKKKLINLPYQPLLKIINDQKNNKIIDIDIVFSPNTWKDPKNTKPLITPPYNWVNPYFWIDNGFYPESSNMRIEDEHYYINRNRNGEGDIKRTPIEEDFQIIFDDIWKICVLKESKASMSQLDFYCYIWLLRYLIENSVIFPIETIDYASWKGYAKSYLDETERPIFEHNSQNILKGWYITEKDSAEKIQVAFLSDIKKILNLLFSKIKPQDGLGIFLNKIYKSYADELINERRFIRCSHCGLLADYLKGKKYCSLLTDGKTCGKRARNKRYYATKGKERLPKYRRTTQELRTLYKERGIKK